MFDKSGLLSMIAFLMLSSFSFLLLFSKLPMFWSCGFLQPLHPNRRALVSILLLSVAAWCSLGSTRIPPVELLLVEGTRFRSWSSNHLCGSWLVGCLTGIFLYPLLVGFCVVSNRLVWPLFFIFYLMQVVYPLFPKKIKKN